jgi:hypothetical protein
MWCGRVDRESTRVDLAGKVIGRIECRIRDHQKVISCSSDGGSCRKMRWNRHGSAIKGDEQNCTDMMER